jgi:uncharacterized protein (DUF2384 family)
MAASAQEQIFANVPRSNHLGFFGKKQTNYKGIINFLNFNKDDVAKATGIPVNSVRYDDKMPQELHDRIIQIATVCELVAEYFKGDIEKASLWFRIDNPMLGDVSPRDMIRAGRFKKLIKFIYNARQGY